MKKISNFYSPPQGHWVGDGFPVRSLFNYNRMGAEQISPFLLLDYAGPHEFAPAQTPRGVGSHPHRGFETVTIVYEGEVEHRDSSGGGGVIAQGDVQWMTAGDGIVHQEFHSPSFTQKGGLFEVVQLWVNLHAKNKTTAPRYQSIVANSIPTVTLANNAGLVRVIAGQYQNTQGPAQIFSPINVWDIRLNPNGKAQFSVPLGHTVMVVTLSGTVQINADRIMRAADLAVFAHRGTEISIEANTDAKLLLLSGEPIDAPVIGYGPFVMNSIDDIKTSIEAFQNGEFGQIAHEVTRS